MAENIPLEKYLTRIASETDKYFTLEEVWSNGEVQNKLASSLVSWPKGRKSLQEHLNHLSESVENFTVVTNPLQPNVIHIMDNRILKIDDYPLDITLRGLTYKGNLSGLLGRINELVPSIVADDQRVSGGKKADDHYTNVTISENKKMSVRDFITLYLPLKGYSRILWVARTDISHAPVTELRFSGPREKVKVTKAQ